jgi:diguanylate cyclase (GGDEF)-like protein
MPVLVAPAGLGKSTLTLTDVIDSSLHVVAQTLNVRLIVLTRISGNTCTLSSVVDKQNTVLPGTVFPFSDSFCMHLLKTGEGRIPDTEIANAAIRRLVSTVEFDLRSYLGVPVMLHGGQIYGVLWAADSGPREWNADDQSTLELFARLLSYELSEEYKEQSAERAEQFDTGPQSVDRLTGLMNRHAFESQLRSEERRLRRYGGVYSVAVLEVDGIHEEPHPHDETIANQLLEGMASTLMLNSRIVDCCARLEGSRFGVLFPETAAVKLPAWKRRIDPAVRTWNMLHPNLGVELKFRLGLADSEEAETFQAMLDLAAERMQAEQQPAVEPVHASVVQAVTATA